MNSVPDGHHEDVWGWGWQEIEKIIWSGNFVESMPECINYFLLLPTISLSYHWHYAPSWWNVHPQVHLVFISVYLSNYIGTSWEGEGAYMAGLATFFRDPLFILYALLIGCKFDPHKILLKFGGCLSAGICSAFSSPH